MFLFRLTLAVLLSLCAAAHGGQVVITDDVARHLGLDIEKLDLGEHRLKDFPQPVALWQLGSTKFPPLRTIRPCTITCTWSGTM